MSHSVHKFYGAVGAGSCHLTAHSKDWINLTSPFSPDDPSPRRRNSIVRHLQRHCEAAPTPPPDLDLVVTERETTINFIFGPRVAHADFGLP
jgi:hypothetical protein